MESRDASFGTGTRHSGGGATRDLVLVKKTDQRQLFTGWVVAVAAVLYSPILMFLAPVVRAVWPYAVVSAIVQGTYFLLLVRAYERADFSLAYPIARGSAPGLLTLWGIVFLGEHVTFIGTQIAVAG